MVGVHSFIARNAFEKMLQLLSSSVLFYWKVQLLLECKWKVNTTGKDLVDEKVNELSLFNAYYIA